MLWNVGSTLIPIPQIEIPFEKKKKKKRNTFWKSTPKLPPLFKGILRGKFSKQKHIANEPNHPQHHLFSAYKVPDPEADTFIYDLILSSQQSHMANHTIPISQIGWLRSREINNLSLISFKALSFPPHFHASSSLVQRASGPRRQNRASDNF